MAIVWLCPLAVDAYAASGRDVGFPRPACPSCAGPLVFWSGYRRYVRAAGRCQKIFVPRLRCARCGVSHALLPAFTLAWRLDVAETVGSVIAEVAGGAQPDQLEELRLLTNAEMDSASPFAGILAGQPTLNRQLWMGPFAALDQRIGIRFAIKPMDLAESAAYLRHHLKLAGREDPLLADDAIARLHRVANGLPRALNNAATAALIAAAAADKDLVDDACAKKAVAELTRD